MAANVAFVAGLLCFIAVASVTNALSSHPYYRDYLRKRANERVERTANLVASLSKLRAESDSEINVKFIHEEPRNVKDIITDVLVDFYRYTGGVYWYRSDFWTLGDPCTWYGITCRGNGTTKEIVEIDLHANNLTNGITAGITNITSLVRLDLSRNSRMYYTVPNELWEMENLEYVDLSYCSFDSKLPNIITGPNLNSVILTGNKFSGLLSVWESEQLRHLLLDGNAFSGKITLSNIKAMEQLVTLTLSRNNFEGLFPDLQFLSEHALKVLWLYENPSLAGPIPSSWKYLTNLEDLEIDHAQGTIPTSVITGWKNISHLSVTNGELNGPIPPEIFCNSTLPKLRYLSFAINSLDGQLISDINQACCGGMADDMDTVDLSSNYLKGNIPACLVTGYVKEVYLHNNYFVGSFPYSADTSRMKNLRVLQVCDNTLSGYVPSYFANADTSELRLLGLCYNQFSTINSDLKDFFERMKRYMTGCLLDHNPFNCPVPDFVPEYCNAVCSACNTGDSSFLCDECVAKSFCGWCGETNSCLEGTYTGPNDEYHCDSSQWRFGNPQLCF